MEPNRWVGAAQSGSQAECQTQAAYTTTQGPFAELRKQCGCVSSLTLHHTVQMTVQLPSKVQCRKFPSNLKSLTLTLTLRPSTGPPKLHLTS